RVRDAGGAKSERIPRERALEAPRGRLERLAGFDELTGAAWGRGIRDPALAVAIVVSPLHSATTLRWDGGGLVSATPGAGGGLGAFGEEAVKAFDVQRAPNPASRPKEVLWP